MIQTLLLLFAGSGQGVFATALTQSAASRLFFVPFALPSLVFFTLYFLQRSPFTFKQHFRIAFGTLYLSSATTLAIEVCLLFADESPLSSAQIAVAQVTMNLGWLAFVPTWLHYRACLRERRSPSDPDRTATQGDLQAPTSKNSA